MSKRIYLLFIVVVIGAAGVWASIYFGGVRWLSSSAGGLTDSSRSTKQSWYEAVELVKADRGPSAYVAVEVPPELRHYEDRHWFLAAQVAEVEKHNVQTCQDFVDLAAMIDRGEMVTLAAVTDTYVLYGVGEKADDEPFTRYQISGGEAGKTPALPAAAQSVELYSEAELNDAYKKLNETRSKLQTEIQALNVQSHSLRKGERDKQKELQEQIGHLQVELNSADEAKGRIDQFYGDPTSRQKLLRDYQSLETLSKNFAGRAYNLASPSDRETMKVVMLSSLRPEAVKILEEVASAYHRQFDRPLPVSSLVRPEQYQHELRKVNRNAVLIETPPHSTGLAFDIDYRYMSATEQTFVMNELARLKREGRIEVIRERNANYHVFAFIDGTRPSDVLIAASREKAGAPTPEESDEDRGQKPDGAQKSEVKRRDTNKVQRTKNRTTKAKVKKRRG